MILSVLCMERESPSAWYCAHEFSARMNLVSPDVADRVCAHLQAAGLPTQISDIPGNLPDADMLMELYCPR